MKTITQKEGISDAMKLAEYNERGRLLLSEGKIYGYLTTTGKRLGNMNAEESAQTIFSEIAKDTQHYEYEPGHLHLHTH